MLEQEGPRAEAADAARLWLTKMTVRPSLRDVLHLAEALVLELGVADREHLVDEQDLRLEVRGDGEYEAHLHSAGEALHGRVEDALDAGAVEVLDGEQVPHRTASSRLVMVTSSAPSSSATRTLTRSERWVGRFLPT